MIKGTLITFEGIDGSGKTTQAQRTVKHLKRKGFDVIWLREPGGEKASESIRKILLNKDHASMDPLTELLLYEASRAQLTQKVIFPALKKGKIVICDRYSDSSLAYQGYGRGLNKKWVEFLNKISTSGLTPHLTILVDVPVELALKRKARMRKHLKKDKDRIEKEKKSFYQKVRKGYLELAKQNKKRYVVINGKEGIDQTWQKVKEKIDKFLKI